jgi:hypothetical protein
MITLSDETENLAKRIAGALTKLFVMLLSKWPRAGTSMLKRSSPAAAA